MKDIIYKMLNILRHEKHFYFFEETIDLFLPDMKTDLHFFKELSVALFYDLFVSARQPVSRTKTSSCFELKFELNRAEICCECNRGTIQFSSVD